MAVAASRRAPTILEKRRSGEAIVYSDVDVKKWATETPGVDRVRPASCTRCGGASRVPGKPLRLVGHGVRERQVRGPGAPDAAPEIMTVSARRYCCRDCGAITTVLPRGLHARRHYSGSAIGLALCLFGMLRLSLAETRRRVCAWNAGLATGTWSTLRNWVDAIAAGRLFSRVRRCPPHFSRRSQAERAASTLVALAPPSAAPLDARAFEGAARAA